MPKIEMNLGDYLRVMRKRKRIIILSFILVIISTIYYTRKQTPLYSTSSKVKIEQRKSVAEILTELVTWAPGDEMTSQANLINSYQLMEQVAERLGAVDSSLSSVERMGRIKAFQSQIHTEQISTTNIIAITATSSNPEQAMVLANTVASVYVDAHFENKKKEASNVKKFVKEQLDSYMAELQKNEIALQRFRQENPLVAERDISTASIQSDPLVTSLKQEIVKLEMELIALKSRYTDEHPDVISLKERLEKNKKDLTNTLNQLAAREQDLSEKEIRLVQLKRDVTMAEDIYSMFKKRYEEARILEAEKAQDVTIIEPAMRPSSPIRPNIRFNILIGLFSGLLIGLVLAFITESLDTTIGRIDDIEGLIKLPVLGIIPYTMLGREKSRIKERFRKKDQLSEKEQFQKRLIALFEPSSVAAEAYKALRTQLELTGLKRVGNCFVITSAAPEEGKTQTLCNLAIAMAQSGQKVLIVESDFRKPMVYKLFGLRRSPGLSEILIGNIPWQKAVNTVSDMLIGGLEYERILNTQGMENLHIITCGERTSTPAELLNFPEMADLIKELKQNFDVILLDSPPTLPVTDSAILGAKADGVLIIYQAGKTSRHALVRAKIQLENVNAKVLGIVINNLKADFIEDVTPYQRYRYYGYYGEKEKKKKK